MFAHEDTNNFIITKYVLLLYQNISVCENKYTISKCMEEKFLKIRIKDIASLAGVSEGTVDRVLHKRGDVSAKSQEAVKKVLEEMNYTPNLFARSLASKKQYRFVSIIPEYLPEEYWERVDKGFDKAAIIFFITMC